MAETAVWLIPFLTNILAALKGPLFFIYNLYNISDTCLSMDKCLPPMFTPVLFLHNLVHIRLSWHHHQETVLCHDPRSHSLLLDSSVGHLEL